MKTITVLGSLNYDVVTRTKVVPKGGETINAESFETHHGGKGANQALAARRLSSKDSVNVKMIGKVGNDNFGHELKESLESEGIDTTKVAVVEGVRTGVSTILVETDSGENRIMFYDGANGTHKTEEITPALFAGSDMVILQNEVPLPVVYQSLKTAHQAGIPTTYNPSPVDANTPVEVFNNVDYLVVNSSEAQVLSQSEDINDSVEQAQKVIKALVTKLGCANAVITLGANGAVYYSSKLDQTGHVPASKVEKIVDTTGAGDTFLGAFSSKVVTGSPLPEAISFAAKAAAIAVTREGAAEGIPHLTEVE
uniref:Ribokinase n=1 Tax=Blastobotrys adeninivorans TaxID=409370 RepID=A0A060TEX7_BLAAD